MRNRALARDYVRRAEVRLEAVAVLHERRSWADVVRESQEIVELALKAALRAAGVDAPRVHDVSEILIAERARFPKTLGKEVPRLARISKSLRRDRELAFYGSEDLTPSDFYTEEDAREAFDGARRTLRLVKPFVLRATS